MKYTSLIHTIIIALLLSAYMSPIHAEETAEQLNDKAEQEHSPYRWVVDNNEDKATLIKQLHGKVFTASSMKGPRKVKLIAKIKAREKSDGRSKNITLKEIRMLPPAGYWGQMVVEAWIFDNEGAEVAYTIWHKNPTDYLLKGPWTQKL